MSARTRILLADDHAVLRAGLRLLINAQPDMEVVAEAATGREASIQVTKASPDVTLLDLSMPRTNGIKIIGQLVRARRSMRVLVLTMHDDEAYLDAALEAGASGYVVKRAADLELLSAIRAVAAGRISIDVTLRARNPDVRRSPVSRGPRRLSPREAQVLRLLGQGYTNREIGARLGVGEKSVETYRGRIGEKLHLHRRAEFVRYALRRGLLSADALADVEGE